jgi:hypothetical protein
MPFHFSGPASIWPFGIQSDRRFFQTLLVIGVIAGVLFFFRTPWQILWALFQDEEVAQTLDLPPELVVAQVPDPVQWHWDADKGGLRVFSHREGPLSPQATAGQFLEPPWKDSKPEPLPTVFTVMGKLINPSGTHALELVPQDQSWKSRAKILSLKLNTVLAESDHFHVLQNGKDVAWHPRMNILVSGGLGHVTLMGEPDWQPKKLATAERDQVDWSRKVQAGEEEFGFHPCENVVQVLFSDDGNLLICAMDRGLRVYCWPEVLKATEKLPCPLFSVDNDLVSFRVGMMRQTYTAQYDPVRKRVLWTGLEGKLSYLDIATKSQGMLLQLPKKNFITRMELLDHGKILCCEIHRWGRETCPAVGLFLLDYPKLVSR